MSAPLSSTTKSSKNYQNEQLHLENLRTNINTLKQYMSIEITLRLKHTYIHTITRSNRSTDEDPASTDELKS